METASAPAKRKRWRFQFSLRALFAVVFCYGLSWTYTSTWGLNSVAAQRANELRGNPLNYHREVKLDSAVVDVGAFANGNWLGSAYHGEGRAIAPFIIQWRWQSSSNPNDTLEETHVCLCGFFWSTQKHDLMGYCGWGCTE